MKHGKQSLQIILQKYIDLLRRGEENNIAHLIHSLTDSHTDSRIDPIASSKAYLHAKQEHQGEIGTYTTRKKQISQYVRTLLGADANRRKIEASIAPLIQEDSELKKITVICLYLHTLDITIDLPLLSELSSKSAYKSDIINNEHFRKIFTISKSSIFCQNIIKTFIDPSYITEILFSIAQRIDVIYHSLNYHSHRDFTHEVILRSCFKFSAIERIFPDNNKMLNIINYYEKLKRIIPWLIGDPYFWLQYAMGFIALKDFNKAQIYITNAYNKARLRKNYYADTYLDAYLDAINTQQARLFFLESIHSQDVQQSIQLFQKGHKLLLSLPNSKYTYRQLYLYDEYRKNKKDFLQDPSWRAKYRKNCIQLLEVLDKKNENDDTDSRRFYYKESSIQNLRAIIASV